MAVTKKILSQYDVKLVTKWDPPYDGDLRALMAQPNVPRPLHGCQPRTILGPASWDRMRKACYAEADFECEICGAKVGVDIEKRRLHSHELFQIDYEKGTSTFVRCFAVCSLDHLFCIHTGRAISLFGQGNPLYPKDLLLEGAEKAFKTVREYNKDHPGADLRLYSTWLDYLKKEELRRDMEGLIEKYGAKFYEEDKKKTAKWKDWKLIFGYQEYPTPYKNEKEWKKAMEEAGKKDTARILQKNIEEKFSGGVYDELNNILKEEDGTPNTD